MSEGRVKRFTYRSFKERLDVIKIEPTRKLQKRAFDEADTSHFLASVERWREFNRSASFTEFVEAVDPLCQSLPQILYYKKDIFKHLVNSISKLDILSLEPLLEVLAQFCHDLGPDFMEFYEEAIVLLKDAALSKNTDPSALEWEFNCLAFIFKYLSRYLSKDLLKTFELLLPLFSAKDHVARFTAEALSFLLRKSTVDELKKVTAFTFESLREDGSNSKGAVICYTESMSSTKGSIHSKSQVIIQTLLEHVEGPYSASVFCDILLGVIAHGSIEAVKDLYNLVIDNSLDKLKQEKDQFFKSYNQILMTLIFAGSGKKISDWTLITAALKNVFEYRQIPEDSKDLVVELLALFLRNCDGDILMKFHPSLYRFASSSLGPYFFAFIRSSYNLSKERTLRFSNSYIQEFINKNYQNYPESISSFIKDFENSDIISKTESAGKFKAFIPSAFADSLYNELQTLDINSSKDLYECYWRLSIIDFAENTNTEVLKSVLTKIQSLEEDDTQFKDVVLSQVVVLLNDSTISNRHFSKLYTNIAFIKGVKDIEITEEYVLLLSENLISPDHELRSATLALINKSKGDESFSEIVSKCAILEEIPLTFQNSRDLKLRIRNLFATFKNLDEKNILITNVLYKFLFGFLSAKFAPIWEAVFEGLPTLAAYNTDLLWDLIKRFINGIQQTREFTDFIIADSSLELNNLSMVDGRLESVVEGIKDVIRFYIDRQASLLADAEKLHGFKEYPQFMRGQAFKALKILGPVAEKHQAEVVSLLLDTEEDPIVEDEDAEEDDEKEEENEDQDQEDVKEDKNDKITAKSQRSKVYGKHLIELLDLFASLKKLKKITRSDEIYQKCLTYLSVKDTGVKKAALNVIFHFNNQQINKYKDNLVNMLDDSTFRDEITKLLANDGSEGSSIESQDSDVVMEIILRILLGKVQTNATSGHKKGFKNSAILVLINLEVPYIERFIDIMSENVGFTDQLEDIGVPSEGYLRISLAYSRALTKVITTLGEKFKGTLLRVFKPLLCSLVSAQVAIENSEADDVVMQSLARNVRQVGFKNLSLLFNLLHEHSWDEYFLVIYDKLLAPRFATFEDENLQQVTSLLTIMTSWSEFKAYHELLLINDLEPARKVLSLLGNVNAKAPVLNAVINFSTNIIKNIRTSSSKFKSLLLLVAKSGFDYLPLVLERSTDFKVNVNCIDLLLNLIQNGFVDSQERRSNLVDLSTQLLEKPPAQLSKDSRLQVLTMLKSLVKEYDGPFDEIRNLWDASSKHLKMLTDRNQRQLLIELFVEFAERFEECSEVSQLIVNLNAYSKRGMNEYDYDVRLAAFRSINDSKYADFSTFEWLPVLNNALFFVTDDDDLSIRTNASYTLRRFIDALTDERERLLIFKNLLLPTLKTGMRFKAEAVQTEYIMLLSHIVANVTVVDDFYDMKVLLFDGDEEQNFFNNVNHIQLYRRQESIKLLGKLAPQISGSNIAHYLLPMIEHYAYVEDEKLRNVGNDTVNTIEKLIGCVSYKQFMAIYKRYLSGLKETSDVLRDSVKLMVTISKALLVNIKEHPNKVQGLPTNGEVLSFQIETEMIQPISKILNKRNDDTIVYRTPLIEALASFIMCLSHDKIVSVLPGVLTSICQILRSRADSLRDAVRKHLARASNIIGAKYTRFIIAELKGALARGFQVHVLGFTVHTILVSMDFQHGELDESAALLMNIVMENLFGSTGQEKEADGYKTTMKEVKNNKSYDIAEILARFISLNKFNTILQPLKMLLRERITAKIQHKLDELIRRISLGLLKNPQLSDHDMLVLCYEIFAESANTATVERKVKTVNPTEQHFLVQLDAKPLRVENETKIFTETFQRLSLDLLRTTLSKNENFINAANLNGFLPFFETALKSENESVLTTLLKVLAIIIHVEFDSEVDIFKTCARRCLNIIKNSPSTDSELVQACYKYLSTVLRQREDLALKETSLGYLLIRIQSDINETSKQGMAFNFIKALVSKHVMIPEVYDTMDKIREVMVTSHSKERRDTSRSIYFQFIMEYDQGRGRLEKQFKFLVDNLGYPAESGKQSVMEFIHLILQKAGAQLLEALSSSFFVGLAKVLISDTGARTKEMAVALITSIFEKQGSEGFDKYISGWMNSKNSSLLRCSLQLYGIKLKTCVGLSGSELDDEVLENIKEILENSKSDSEVGVQWELLYSALNCLSVILDKDTTIATNELLKDLISTLLFPHSWIRLSAARIMNVLITKECILDTSAVQNIAYRLFHQLRAPGVDKALCAQAVKFLMTAVVQWESGEVMFDKALKLNDADDDEAEEQAEAEEENEEQRITNWALTKASSVIRSHKSSNGAKRSCIQLLAMSVQILTQERVQELIETLILPLYNLSENINGEEDEQFIELQNLSLEALKMIEDKVGISDYTQAYSNVRSQISKVRQERRTKRARLAITAPDVAARRKNRKHEKTREKRKMAKDENGFYHTKKKRTLRR